MDLHSARGSNGFGINPLSYTEIDAWNRITCAGLTAQEVKIIKRLDMIYLAHQAKQTKTKGKQ
jgi:hypothetical protein